MEINEYIREFLLSFRNEKGLTQGAMSQLLGIQLRTYAKIDKTGDIKTVEDVYSIIEHTGMDLAQMIASSKGGISKYKRHENNNSDPPQELIERIKKLEDKLESKEEQLENAAHAYSALRKEFEDLQIKYNELKKGSSPRRTGTGG